MWRLSDKTAGVTANACRYCEDNHAPKQCPAYGKTCGHCHKPNHFARVCQQKHGTAKAVNPVKDLCKEEEERVDGEPLFISQIFVGSMKDPMEWTEVLDFGTATVKFTLDTGTSSLTKAFELSSGREARQASATWRLRRIF
jgi:hypothetical protein